MQQKLEVGNERIDRCLGYLYAKADPDRNFLWSRILEDK